MLHSVILIWYYLFKIKQIHINMTGCFASPQVMLSFQQYIASSVTKCYNMEQLQDTPTLYMGGRRSPAVACWASDHWVASSNPLRGKFRH